jgi:transposase
MSNRIFSLEEIVILSKNKYVKNISEKAITYTDEFKQIFIAENQSGKLPIEIFERHGFDTNILGKHRIKSAGKRWRAVYRENGILGLQDARTNSSGRPKTKDLTLQEKYERLELKVKLLKAENELLKKIKMMERRLRK